MKLTYPSPEFDACVAGICHDKAGEEVMQAMNQLLLENAAARDEYLLRIELHSRLASDPDLFCQVADLAGESCVAENLRIVNVPAAKKSRSWLSGRQILALAACIALFAAGIWSFWYFKPSARNGTTSSAVAMLTHSVEAR